MPLTHEQAARTAGRYSGVPPFAASDVVEASAVDGTDAASAAMAAFLRFRVACPFLATETFPSKNRASAGKSTGTSGFFETVTS